MSREHVQETDPSAKGRGVVTWIRGHLGLVIAAAIVAVAGLVFVLVWFEPQQLFIDDTVDEAFPAATATTAAPTTTATVAPPTTAATTVANTDDGGSETTTTSTTSTTTTTTTTTAGPQQLTDGSFIDVGHVGTGIAQVFLLPDGSRVLRIEDLDVSNGPDLRVIFSTTPLTDDRDAYDEEFVDIGELKGNIGNQNYDIPAEVVLEDYATVAIWCRRFNYTFNAAPLTPVESG